MLENMRIGETKSVVIAFGAGLGTGLLLTTIFHRCKSSDHHSRHAKQSEEAEIEMHILSTQVPAQALGIVVDKIDATSLVLSCPLDLNRNVHLTAFAGSLYSLGVLSAYYLGRAWVKREGLEAAGYQLVAKSGRISYNRPVTTARIVARSELPSEAALTKFRRDLEATGKATVDLKGVIFGGEEKVGCEFTIEVCGFRPRVKASA